MSEWYYMNGGQQMGPVSAKDLKALAASGGLGPEDLVWTQSATDWVPANRVRGLSFPSASAPAQPAPAEYAPPAQEAYLQESSPAYYGEPAPAQALAYAAPGMEGVSAGTIEILRQTRPWARIIAVLTFVWAGLLVLMAVLGLVLAGFGAANSGRRGGGAIAAGVGVGMFVIYIIMATLVFFPGLFLIRYATGISKLQQTGRSGDLEAALASQKSYFLYIGVLSLIMAALGVLSLVVQLLAFIH